MHPGSVRGRTCTGQQARAGDREAQLRTSLRVRRANSFFRLNSRSCLSISRFSAMRSSRAVCMSPQTDVTVTSRAFNQL